MGEITLDQRILDRLEELAKENRVDNSGDGKNNRTNALTYFLGLLRPKTILEIGSHKGVTTELFCLLCEKVVCVDPWDTVDGQPEMFSKPDAFNIFKKRMEPYADKLEVHVGKSPEALYKMPTNSFDMCYIDGNHDFDDVLKDISECRRLVKDNHLLAGHDYGWIPQVTAAVNCGLGREPDILLPDSTWVACNAV